MALTAVETGIQGLADRLAYLRGAASEVALGGTDLWDRIDNTDDEAFENRMVGADLTAADTALEDLPLGQVTDLRPVIANLESYCRTDLGLAGFDAYLTAQGWRVPNRFASAYYEATGVRLSAANVHPTADAGADCPGLSLGTLLRGGALVAGSTPSTTLYGPGVVIARVTAIGSADWTVTVTLDRDDDTTEAVEQVVDGTGGGGAVGDIYVLGAEAVSVESVAGQADVSVAATAQFAAGQKVLLIEWTGSAPNEVWTACEVAEIDSLTENTSLAMTTNLLHTYSASAYVYPLWADVSAASGSGGTAEDAIGLFFGADRRLRL